jgi:hypothetical protein
MEILNAIIKYAEIKYDDYNRLALHITVESGAIGSLLVFPIYKLQSVMDLLEVRSADKIKGSYLRIANDSNIVRQIGNIITDKWIDSF